MVAAPGEGERGIRMKRVVPTIKFKHYLLVPIQIELDDSTVDALQEQVLHEIDEYGVKAIIMDVSMVDIIDSYISFSLSETATMAMMMGCTMVICGIQPQVALTLAQMGVQLKNIKVARDLEHALEMLSDTVPGYK